MTEIGLFATNLSNTLPSMGASLLAKLKKPYPTQYRPTFKPLGLEPELLEQWQDWAAQRVSAFQRTSSAVEGRNGVLSGLHHNHRGLPKQRFQVWRVLHNFDCRASDGTTQGYSVFEHNSDES
jgi:hypothetical protein